MNTQKKTIYKIHKKTFSSFIPAAVITLALVMYETNKRRAKSAAGQQLQEAQDAEEAAGKEKA